MEDWAPKLDTHPEIDGSGWPKRDLARHVYRAEDGMHARWEAEDGEGARGTGTVFIHPETGAVSTGELAHAEAQKYRAGLLPEAAVSVGSVIAQEEFVLVSV